MDVYIHAVHLGVELFFGYECVLFWPSHNQVDHVLELEATFFEFDFDTGGVELRVQVLNFIPKDVRRRLNLNHVDFRANARDDAWTLKLSISEPNTEEVVVFKHFLNSKQPVFLCCELLFVQQKQMLQQPRLRNVYLDILLRLRVVNDNL